MGVIGRIFKSLFGGGRNVIAQTAGVFRENTEAGAQRRANYDQAALAQYAAEFQFERIGFFDRFMDGLNRLPRPLMVLGVFLLFGSAMYDPIWFAERMQGLILVPEPLWWMFGTIVVFYFGGRAQVKSQEFHKSVARTTTMLPEVVENIAAIRKLDHDSPLVADTVSDAGLALEATAPSDNAAVREWEEATR